MNKITLDLVKLIEQAAPQVFGSIDAVLLQQWLDRNTGTTQLVSLELDTMSVENEAETTPLLPGYLQVRVNDVITFGDNSELRIHVLAPPESGEDLATGAYWGLLGAISNIQAI